MRLLAVTAMVMGLLTVPAFAQNAPTTPTVNLSVTADMKTLKDPNNEDHFTVNIVDAQINTSFNLTCTAGHAALLIIHKDKICAFDQGSTGNIVHPTQRDAQGNPVLLPRAQYVGSYTVTKDGTTDAKSLAINYLPVGKVPPSNVAFGGSLNLKPELTSTGAAGLKNLVLSKLQSDSGSPINTATDTIDFNNFFVPGAGLPSDTGCTWSGNAVFTYQTYSWFFKVAATCNGQTYQLNGNMPYTDTAEGESQYNVVLTLPQQGAATADDALFADTGDSDLFATANGISGQIVMKNSQIVTVKVDQEEIETPAYVQATGTFTGNGVPIEVVRSFATLIGLLPSTFFGA